MTLIAVMSKSDQPGTTVLVLGDTAAGVLLQVTVPSDAKSSADADDNGESFSSGIDYMTHLYRESDEIKGKAENLVDALMGFDRAHSFHIVQAWAKFAKG